MPDTDDKLEQERKEFNSFLDFELGKSHQTLFEAGKGYSSAFVTYLFLISVTVLLVLGGGVDGKVSVPLLGLQLDKIWAAGATLILSNISLFWLFSTYTYSQILEHKFWASLNKRYSIQDNKPYQEQLSILGSKPVLWHILFPSLPLSVASLLLILPKALSILLILMLAVLAIVGIYGLPIYLAWQIDKVAFFWVVISTLVPVLISQLTCTIFLPLKLKKLDTTQLDATAIKQTLKTANERNLLYRTSPEADIQHELDFGNKIRHQAHSQKEKPHD